MERFQGLLGVIVIFAFLILFSRSRRHIKWRTLGIGLLLQIVFALVVLKWSVGFHALKGMAKGVKALTGFADKGTEFVFAPLAGPKTGFVFALNVLPVIIFLGALIGALYYMRVIQYFVEYVGLVLNKLMGTSKIESVYASTVIFLGMSEAPLFISPYLKKLTRSELFACLSGGFASVAGSTLIGYALLGAPLEYLLAASLMNAPGCLIVAKAFMPETEESDLQVSVKEFRDTESRNIIDAIGRGAMSGGKIAIAVGCMLIAFIALITMMDAIIGGIGGWFSHPHWTLEGLFGAIFAPLSWLIGVPWHESAMVGNFIGQKTILNEFVGYTAFGPMIPKMTAKAVMITTFALAGFANLGSIAVQIGTYGALVPERRGEVARYAPMALVCGFCTNMLNAALVGIIAS